jgi:hypothetical protein
MNTSGVVLLVVGILVLVGGMGMALFSADCANSMGWMERQLYPEEYNDYVTMNWIGWMVAGVGGIMAIAGLVVAVAVETKAPTQTTVQPGQAQYGQVQHGPVTAGVSNFCSYCGQQTAPGALMCPRCGRKLG